MIKNLKALLPYLGVLFIFAGIIGLVLIQDPLETSQDLRSEADEIVHLANIESRVTQDFIVDETGQIGVDLDSGGYSVSQVTVYFLMQHPLLDAPEISIPDASGFEADSIEVEAVDGGYLVRVVAVPNNIDWFVPPEDTTFMYIDAIAHNDETLYLTFDADRSFLSTPSLDILLGVPERQAIPVTDPNPPGQSACSASGGTWETFPNSCVDSCEKAADPGLMCLTVLTDGCNCGPDRCWDGDTCVNNPGTEPTPTPTPTPTPDPEVAQCNEICEANADCDVGLRCLDLGSESRCRLATNTSSETCEDARGGIDPDLASCNEYCTSNAECETGYSCYENYCRNPRNPQDNRCAAPSQQQASAAISSCGESCASNAECAINLRCFTGECRLATNVSSTTCTPATEQTVSKEYESVIQNAQSQYTPAPTPQPDSSDDESTQKGAQMVPVTDVEYTPVEDRTADKKAYDDTYDANETLFDLIRSMAQNEESRLPFFVILLGILLLVGSGLIFFFSSMRKKQTRNHAMHSETLNGKISVESHEVKGADSSFTAPTSQRTAIPQETKQELLQSIREK